MEKSKVVAKNTDKTQADPTVITTKEEFKTVITPALINEVFDHVCQVDDYGRFTNKDDLQTGLSRVYEARKMDFTTGYLVVKDSYTSEDVDLPMESNSDLRRVLEYLVKVSDILFFSLVKVLKSDLQYVSRHPKSEDLIIAMKKQLTSFAVWINKMTLQGSKKNTVRVPENMRYSFDTRQAGWKISNTKSVNVFVAMYLLLHGNEESQTGEQVNESAIDIF